MATDPRSPQSWTATAQRLPADWPGADGDSEALVISGTVDLQDSVGRLIHALQCEQSYIDGETGDLVTRWYAVYWCRMSGGMRAILLSVLPDGGLALFEAPLIP